MKRVPGLRNLVVAVAAWLAGSAALSFACSPAWADVWTLDRSAAQVRFTYDHFGLSRQSGEIRDIEGKLIFSPTEPERGSVEVVMKAASISTGKEALDRLLRSPDFFDAGRHPEIRFKSTRVMQTGDIADRTGELTGDLTLLGVSHPVTLQVKWNYTGEYPLSSINSAYINKWVSGFSAKGRIQRSQWGMQRGIPLLSDDVEIAIEVEFLRTGTQDAASGLSGG